MGRNKSGNIRVLTGRAFTRRSQIQCNPSVAWEYTSGMYRLLCFLLLNAPVKFAAGRNILLIIADDYGQDSAALYNTSAAASLPPTPNIASLRSGGVLFRNAWAHPTCSP